MLLYELLSCLEGEHVMVINQSIGECRETFNCDVPFVTSYDIDDLPHLHVIHVGADDGDRINIIVKEY